MTPHDTQITVTAVRTREVLVPFKRPLATRAGMFASAPVLLVDLETREGVVGRVPAFGFHPQGPALIGHAVRSAASTLFGKTIAAHQLAQVSSDLLNGYQLLGFQGIMRFAQSVLDMALYDAMARAAELPLYAFLGARPCPIPAYNSNGLGLLPPYELEDEALRLLDDGGYEHIKCRGGRERPDEDIQAVEAIKNAAPSGTKVSIDFNQSLSRSTALERIEALDGLDLLWIEEPVHSDDLALSADLVRSLSTPIMMGENYYGADSVERAFDAQAFDLLMPDVLRIGGVSGWLHAAQFCAARNIEMSSHLSPEFSVHLLSATPTAGWLEFVDWGAELIQAPLSIDAGKATAPDRLGAGIEWNEDAVSRFLTKEARAA